MNEPTGTSHLSSHIARASLHGPAERTLIEPWLTEYAGLMTNAYPDEHPDAGSLATVATLGAQLPLPAGTTMLAA